MKPSMEAAAQIRDVAARHSYVFDNGLCSPDFFDVDKRTASEEFALLTRHCEPEHEIFEVGCLTGLNLLGLATLGYPRLAGLDFVRGAVEWLRAEAHKRDFPIATAVREFPGTEELAAGIWAPDRIVAFDVIEHQLNVGQFLQACRDLLAPGGKLLVLVPTGEHFFDCGHTAFWPSPRCLTNTLDYFFEVEEVRPLESCEKMFAVCARRES